MGNLGDAAVHTRSILRPHGVFAVISPFNFPMALAAGPTGAALIAGNTVVFKPSLGRAAVGRQAHRGATRRRRPGRRRQPRHGPGRDRRRGAPGEPRHRRHRLHRLVRGRDATSSSTFSPDVPAADASSRWAARTRPSSRARPTSRRRPRGSCARAFGFGGQKCSANSRVYVERPVHDELVRLLVEKTEAITIGDPLRARELARPDHRPEGRRPAPGGGRRGAPRRDASSSAASDSPTAASTRGFYVEPTVVGDLPADHRLFRDELFAPFTAVHAVDSLDEALDLANDTIYGPDRRRLQRGPGRGRAVPRPDRGRRPVRQPPRRRDDRRVAGRPGVRRLEGHRLDRQGRRCRCTTSRSSCASRATPSSTDTPTTPAASSAPGRWTASQMRGAS